MAVKIDKDTCIGCSACVETCPVGALSIQDDKAVCDADNCIDCLACVGTCPVSAITE
jgi:Fe-S-cluster-containing hydrogenase component 2